MADDLVVEIEGDGPHPGTALENPDAPQRTMKPVGQQAPDVVLERDPPADPLTRRVEQFEENWGERAQASLKRERTRRAEAERIAGEERAGRLAAEANLAAAGQNTAAAELREGLNYKALLEKQKTEAEGLTDHEDQAVRNKAIGQLATASAELARIDPILRQRQARAEDAAKSPPPPPPAATPRNPALDAFLSRHRGWWERDQALTLSAQSIDAELGTEGKLSVDDPEYFEELERRLAQRHPDRDELKDIDMDRAPDRRQQQDRPRAAQVAPVPAGSGITVKPGAKGPVYGVRLTEEERQIAKGMGLTAAAYAQGKLDNVRRREYSDGRVVIQARYDALKSPRGMLSGSRGD